MNVKKTMRKCLVVVMIFFILTPFLVGADPMSPSNDDLTRGSFAGEAAEAVVGRVFGVEGDASDIKYHVVEMTHRSPSSAATRSLLVPGWGQYFNTQRGKGIVFFVMTAGALFGSASLYNKSKEIHRDYEAQGVQDSSLYSDYEDKRAQAVVLGAAGALLWSICVVDAYKNAFHPLYSKNTSVEVALIDDGAQISFKKSFQ